MVIDRWEDNSKEVWSFLGGTLRRGLHSLFSHQCFASLVIFSFIRKQHGLINVLQRDLYYSLANKQWEENIVTLRSRNDQPIFWSPLLWSGRSRSVYVCYRFAVRSFGWFKDLKTMMSLVSFSSWERKRGDCEGFQPSHRRHLPRPCRLRSGIDGTPPPLLAS
jgi:hypothetical protein